MLPLVVLEDRVATSERAATARDLARVRTRSGAEQISVNGENAIWTSLYASMASERARVRECFLTILALVRLLTGAVNVRKIPRAKPLTH